MFHKSTLGNPLQEVREWVYGYRAIGNGFDFENKFSSIVLFKRRHWRFSWSWLQKTYWCCFETGSSHFFFLIYKQNMCLFYVSSLLSLILSDLGTENLTVFSQNRDILIFNYIVDKSVFLLKNYFSYEIQISGRKLILE